MKQLSTIIAVVFLFSACQSKPDIPKYNKNDSFVVRYTYNGFRQEVGARIDSIYVQGKLKDPSRSLDAYWEIDTVWSINIRVDTLRGADKKPVYDSISKGYKFKMTWYRLTEKDMQSISKIKIID